jgi:hypothetical protein
MVIGVSPRSVSASFVLEQLLMPGPRGPAIGTATVVKPAAGAVPLEGEKQGYHSEQADPAQIAVEDKQR